MYFICSGFIFCAANLIQLGTVCEEKWQNSSRGIWKRYSVLFGIDVGSSNMHISQHLGVDLRTEHMIRKELNEFNGDYVGIAAWKPHSGRSDKNSRICWCYYAIIDHDPRMSVRAIIIDMKVSEFLIKQVVYEGIRYFPYKISKSQFLSQTMEDNREDCVSKLMNKFKSPLKPNILWFFSNKKKISTRITWWIHRTTFALSPQDLLILMKTKHPDSISV